MKNINSDVLRALPEEVKQLLRNGVYSLYTLKAQQPAYVLVTDRGERYCLDATGNVVSGASLGDLGSAIDQPVILSGNERAQVLVNCA